MGKVVQLKPKTVRSGQSDAKKEGRCPKCQHFLNVHITHPNGVVSCVARGCNCETRPNE